MKSLTTILFFSLFTISASCQPFTCGDSLIDPRDGQKYATVLIGSDCWFKQNLNYGNYVESTTLSSIHSQQTNNGIAEKYAQLNTPANFGIYGGLYEQAELMNYNTSGQGLCPLGWHVSTDQEWNNLITIAGGNMQTSTGGIGGNRLKKIGEGFGNGAGTDNVGISLIHGGDRDGFGAFYGMGNRAIYWTSTSAGINQAYHYTLWASNDTIERLPLGVTTTAFSCRCIKDLTADLNETSPEKSLFIHPNPFTESTMINSTTEITNGKMIIQNSIGETVLTFQNLNGKVFELHRNDLKNGIYFITITDDNKTVLISKMVITN